MATRTQEVITVPTNSSRAGSLLSDSNPDAGVPVKSYARANQELAAAFDRYLLARGFTSSTRRSYGSDVLGFLESLGSTSAVQADHLEIRQLFGELMDRGVGPHNIRRHTASLRCFFRFLQLSGLRRNDPTLRLPHRKLPRRMPRVLTIEEIERLIAAAKNPLEAAVAEFLYATGVRVSELIAIRLENIYFVNRIARVKKGKGGKDRIVLYGSHADAAIRQMLEWRSRKTKRRRDTPKFGTWRWGADWRLSPNDLKPRLLHRADRPTLESETGFLFGKSNARPYTAKHIREIVSRMGVRAGVGRVYPHALRRAFASHMLEGGADLRAIQDLLGHEQVTATALYTSLSDKNLKEIHTRYHPTAEGSEHAEEK